MLTEVVDRGRKLYFVDGSCIVDRERKQSRMLPSATLVKVKISFDESQKLTWKEIKCLYGLIKIITSNYISEVLKMQLESRSRNFHT